MPVGQVPEPVDWGQGWYRRRLATAATRAFRLIPLSARAKLSTSRWLGVLSSGVLQKEKMVRPLRLRPESAAREGKAEVALELVTPAWLMGPKVELGPRVGAGAQGLSDATKPSPMAMK